LEGTHKRRQNKGDKEPQSIKKLVPHIVGLGPENTLADPLVLSTLRYGEKAYGSAPCAVLRQLDAVHHKGVRLAICRTENLLCDAGLSKLDEIRKFNSI
jgi:hypothetical protein